MEQDFCVKCTISRTIKMFAKRYRQAGAFGVYWIWTKKERVTPHAEKTDLSAAVPAAVSVFDARAACEPDPAGSTVIEESLDPETPEEPVMSLGVEGGETPPDKDDAPHP